MLTPDKVKITPQNIVASCKFGVTLPLERIARELGAEFTPEQFPGAIYHMPQGHTFLLFKNGKAVLAGCRSEPQLYKAAEDLRKELRKVDVEIIHQEIEIQNLVFSLELGVWIDLEHFVEQVLDSDYSPELFPGLTYKIRDPSATFLIFSSGKCVLAGLKNIRDLQRAIEKLVETVNNSGAVKKTLKTAASMKEEERKETAKKAASAAEAEANAQAKMKAKTKAATTAPSLFTALPSSKAAALKTPVKTSTKTKQKPKTTKKKTSKPKASAKPKSEPAKARKSATAKKKKVKKAPSTFKKKTTEKPLARKTAKPKKKRTSRKR